MNTYPQIDASILEATSEWFEEMTTYLITERFGSAEIDNDRFVEELNKLLKFQPSNTFIKNREDVPIDIDTTMFVLQVPVDSTNNVYQHVAKLAAETQQQIYAPEDPFSVENEPQEELGVADSQDEEVADPVDQDSTESFEQPEATEP